MSNSINFIRVVDKENNAIFINVNDIVSIAEYSEHTVIFLVSSGVYTTATASEIFNAIAKVRPVNDMYHGDIPSVGVDNEASAEPVEKDPDAPQKTESEGLDEHGLNPVQSEIVDIVRNFKFNRYRDLKDALTYFCLAKVTVGNGDGEDYTGKITNIEVNEDGRPMVTLDDGGTYDISAFSDEDEERILDRLKAETCFETMYEWVNEDTDLYEYIAIYNASVKDPRSMILSNTEENLNKFQLSAGELMKSMVNGMYKKDDAYILVFNNELISFNDPCEHIELYDLVDYMLANPEYAKQVMPEDKYNAVFG